MNVKARLAMTVLAAVLGGIGATARAEPTLQYNHDYVCERGLRIVVGHCRHDSDMPGVAPTAPEDDYCQVYYPDRPKTGGIEAMEVVLRGHLIESLQACGALGTTAKPPGGTAKSNSAGAAAAPGVRPPSRPMPIGPAMCPLLVRLEALAREDFRSIDLGPDRAARDPAVLHRTAMAVPGVDCTVDHYPGDPVTYVCIWPQSKQAEDQFVSMVEAFKKCTGGDPDMSMIKEFGLADVTLHLCGVDYHTYFMNDSLILEVFMARP